LIIPDLRREWFYGRKPGLPVETRHKISQEKKGVYRLLSRFSLLTHLVPETINVFIMYGVIAFPFFEAGRTHLNGFFYAIVFRVEKFP
jgi:hypothetical protein